MLSVIDRARLLILRLPALNLCTAASLRKLIGDVDFDYGAKCFADPLANDHVEDGIIGRNGEFGFPRLLAISLLNYFARIVMTLGEKIF